MGRWASFNIQPSSPREAPIFNIQFSAKLQAFKNPTPKQLKSSGHEFREASISKPQAEGVDLVFSVQCSDPKSGWILAPLQGGVKWLL
jgi:hypothetical protein